MDHKVLPEKFFGIFANEYLCHFQNFCSQVFQLSQVLLTF